MHHRSRVHNSVIISNKLKTKNGLCFLKNHGLRCIDYVRVCVCKNKQCGCHCSMLCYLKRITFKIIQFIT
jgi:hypothetical protein